MTTKIGTASDYIDLLNIIDAFLTEHGHAWGLTFDGVGSGRMRGPGGTTGGYTGTASSVTETITITATSSTSFNVVGTISGALGVATVGTDFTSPVLEFRIVAGSTAFVAGDFFRLNTGPKWEKIRFGGCIEGSYRTSTYSDVNKIFDGNTTSSSGHVSASTLPQSITVEMQPTPTKVRAFSLWGYSSTYFPKAFNLQWSDDGSAWTTAQSWDGQSATQTYDRKDYVLSSDPGSHRFWRLNITGANSGTTTNVQELRLFSDQAMKVDVSSRLEFAWKAPGVDGAQEIFVAGFSQAEPSIDVYNIGFRGFRFWQDPTNSVRDVDNNSGSKYLYLSRTPIAYWLVANGGRIVIETRISGIYQMTYAGFGLPYETPAIHPFPYIVAASAVNPGWRWDGTGATMLRMACDPMGQDSNPDAADQCSAAAIFPNGQMIGIANRYPSGSSAEGGYPGIASAKTWPYTFGLTGSTQPEWLRDSIDGSKPILPVVLFFPGSPVHVWGEFDGILWTTGFGNTAEAIIRNGAVDCLVVPNVYRTTINSFAAIALD